MAIENGRVITQVRYDKCFYVATKFSACDQLKAGFFSRQRKIYCDTKLRVHNEMQQDFVGTKKFSVVTKTT